MKRKDFLKTILSIFILTAIAISVGVALLFLSNTQLVGNLELRTLDYRFAFRGRSVPVSPAIKIIALDEKSFRKIDEPFFLWPSLLAEIMEKLVQNDVKVVGIDLLQGKSIEEYKPGQTKEMQKALLSGKIVLISVLETDGSVKYPIAPLVAVAGMENIGLSNASPDMDDVIRRQPIHLEAPDGSHLPCFPFLVAAKYLGGELYQGDDHKYRIGKKIIRDENGHVAINYAGPPGSFQTYSFYNVLERAKQNDDKYFTDNFKDKIVLIGSTDIMSKDLFVVPFNVVNQKMMSGIEIHANTINTILQGAYLVPVKNSYNMAILFILSLVISFLCYFTRPIWGISISIIILAAFIGSSFYLFSHFGYAIKVVIPSISIPMVYGVTLLYRYLTVDRKMRKFRNVFGKLVSPSVENELWKEEIEVELGKGVEKHVTILFSDINNFTPMCESNSADKVMEMLNINYTEMIDIVFKNRGTVGKFVGDEIMVLFGAPGAEPRQAFLAIKTAVEMIDRLREMENKAEEPGFHDVKIGIHTGSMKVGFIGSSKRMDYTVVGENVNLASRLEGLTKKHKSYILISEDTYKKLNEEVENYKELLEGVNMEKIGEPQDLKGFKKKINVYKVLKKGWIKNEKSK